jgi:hypothetical protein
MVGPGAPCGLNGTMYEERIGAIVWLKDEYGRKGREETVIGKGLTAGSSPPYQ